MAAWVTKLGAFREPDAEAIADVVARHEAPFSRPHGNTNALREALYEIMWNDVGIARTASGLARADSSLAGLQEELGRTGVACDTRAFNLSWHDWLNLRSLIAVSRAIVIAAVARQDSRGAHFREDFPDTGDLPSSSYTLVHQAGEKLTLTTQRVLFTRIQPGESLLTQ